MSQSKLKNVFLFIGCLILCQAAGGLGTIATIPNIPVWYEHLHQPSFRPPNWLFGPVWGILYTLMAVALYTVIKSAHPQRGLALRIFFLQLALNAAWSFLFFEYHLLLLSLIEIIGILATLIWFTIVAAPVSLTAMYCFFPYIAWVSFATLLNASIWYLN